MSDELVDLMARPLAAVDNALSSLAKKTASSTWDKFKRFLSTASEPFFRKDMGERYFNSESLTGGAAIWGGATLLALLVPGLSSVTILFEASGLYKLAHLFHFCQFWPLTIVSGGLLVFFHIKFGLQSLGLMGLYRAQGTAYHTQSRGVARWGDDKGFVPFAIIAALFLFDMPAGILFVVSISLSAKLASEQQAAIYARYLDALDQKIEQEYLENAILGKCPTEITQLHKPLAADMNSDLRNNIAAAAVGKSVKIVAKSPQGTFSPAQPAAAPVPPQ
jgi:hypothetical protein